MSVLRRGLACASLEWARPAQYLLSPHHARHANHATAAPSDDFETIVGLELHVQARTYSDGRFLASKEVHE